MKKSDFQRLLTLLSLKGLTDLDDRRVWSLDSSSHFSVKSLSSHFSPSSPLEKDCFKALWKTSSSRRINVLVGLWQLVFLTALRLCKGSYPIIVCCHPSEHLVHFSFSAPSD